VFAAALSAHGEGRHGGALAIVRRAGHDGEARPAVGAVEERVAMTVIARIVQLAQAVGAGGDIGRDEHGPTRAGFTRVDAESGFAARLLVFTAQLLDARQRRRASALVHVEAVMVVS